MITFLRKIHYALLIASMIMWFFLLWPPLYYFSLQPSRYKGMIWLRRIWAICSSLCVGIIYRFEYEEEIDWSKAYVICPNHTSNLDTSMICAMLHMDRFHFMGKEELLNGMITGIFFRTVDIPVNRDNKISAYRAFKAAKEKLSQGSSMIMFPEGGISNEYPPKVQEFKNGPFRLAIDAQVSIIPVTSLNTWKVFWDDGNERGSRPGVCRIFVHKPIATHNYQPSDASALEEKVFGVIKEKFLEA